MAACSCTYAIYVPNRCCMANFTGTRTSDTAQSTVTRVCAFLLFFFPFLPFDRAPRTTIMNWRYYTHAVRLVHVIAVTTRHPRRAVSHHRLYSIVINGPKWTCTAFTEENGERARREGGDFRGKKAHSSSLSVNFLGRQISKRAERETVRGRGRENERERERERRRQRKGR